MNKSVLITGASGRIGRHATQAFAAAGWQVQIFQRGTDLVEAAKGTSVIVNGMNPPNYKNWATLLPQITKQHIKAAQASGARVILPGNVYNFGADQSGLWDEQTPQKPCSRKGQIRVDAEQAYKDSGVACLVLRAGNFIDPEGRDDVLSALHLSRLSRGKILSPGSTQVRQAWCYLPDWARAAERLVVQDLDTFEDIPFAGHTASVADLQREIEASSGRMVSVARFPWWAVRLASPIWPFGRELLEMRYLWDLDHALSDRRLKTRLPEYQATPLQKVIAEKWALHFEEPKQ